MATYNNTKKTYYSISDGKLKRYEGDGKISEFDAIDGIFQGISQRTREINGEMMNFVDFNFTDEGERFCVSCVKFSSPCNTIVSCLVNVKDFASKILISVWKKDAYTNVSVSQNDQKVPWVDLPKKESFTLPSGEIATSFKKRNDFIEKTIADINAAVQGTSSGQPAAAAPTAAPTGASGAVVDDMPADDAPAPTSFGPAPAPVYGDPYPPYVPNAGE